MTTDSSADLGPVPAFAHASEAEMARILDFYEVRWEYEPHRFPLLWNLDGDVVESFSPDFWLPDLELYLELTTLKQRLVRKKNRKLRRLRELYPEVRVKLFYGRDFRALMLKYGKLGGLAELSGTAGQLGLVGSLPEPGDGAAAVAPPVVVRPVVHLPPEPSTAITAADPAVVPGSPSTAARRRARRRLRRLRDTAAVTPSAGRPEPAD